MVEQKRENMINRVVFALFLVLIFSLGMMKPGIETPLTALTPTDLVFPILFVAWLVAIATRRMRFVWHPAYVAFAVYFFALALSAVFSNQPRLSFAKLAGEGYLMLLPVVVVGVVTSVERLKVTLYVWIAGAATPVLIGLLGIALYYFSPDTALLREITYHYGSVPVGNFPRLSSTFVSASMFCNYLTVTIAILAGCWSMNWLGKRAVLVLLFATCVCAAFTVSIALGGALLAGGLLVWKLTERSSIRTIGLTAAIIGAIGFLVISPFSPNPATLNVHYNFEPPFAASLASSRLMVWTDATRRFVEDPIVGSGVGTPAANVIYVNTDGTISLLTDAHNMFLNVAVQAGVIGLVGLLFVVWSVTRAGFRGRSDRARGIRMALAIAFVAAFLYDGLTGSYENARHLWILIGLILAMDSLKDGGATGEQASRLQEGEASKRKVTP